MSLTFSYPFNFIYSTSDTLSNINYITYAGYKIPHDNNKLAFLRNLKDSPNRCWKYNYPNFKSCEERYLANVKEYSGLLKNGLMTITIEKGDKRYYLVYKVTLKGLWKLYREVRQLDSGTIISMGYM